MYVSDNGSNNTIGRIFKYVLINCMWSGSWRGRNRAGRCIAGLDPGGSSCPWHHRRRRSWRSRQKRSGRSHSASCRAKDCGGKATWVEDDIAFGIVKNAAQDLSHTRAQFMSDGRNAMSDNHRGCVKTSALKSLRASSFVEGRLTTSNRAVHAERCLSLENCSTEKSHSDVFAQPPPSS